MGAYVTAPATPEAAAWAGWGTALKPAWEPICVARKPIRGTVAANVLAHGTGALNIDGCRIEGELWQAHEATGLASEKFFTRGEAKVIMKTPHDLGRWPANLVHDGSDEVLACFPDAGGGFGKRGAGGQNGIFSPIAGTMQRVGFGDSGSAARFFYTAKSSRSERGEGNDHPTVKPVELMRWLVRLVCPPGGTVLDPFAGSGTTGIACAIEQFDCLLIERDPKHAETARQRILASAGLFADV
jgi:site-specific DNA-methyltransferase (adenine-specific)